MTMIALLVAGAAFVLSASAGMGGSLLLVPAMVLLFGAKQGVATAALLLAANNVAKVIAYRHTVPLRASLVVIVLTVLGAFVGGSLLLALPERVVQFVVVIGVMAALVVEQLKLERVRRGAVPVLAFAAGASSGVSGTSGPLKGIALRGLGFDRAHFVGAASVVSLAGDVTKLAVFAQGGLLVGDSLLLLAMALPLMAGGTWLGRRLNRGIGERGYALLFWGVMGGYSLRLLL